MEVLFGIPSDLEQWMNLVKRVSWNFPGLETEESIEEHSRTVLRFMNKKQALCIKRDNEIAGVILFSRNRNMICFLAVAPEYRQHGMGAALLEKALSELDRSKDISVSTFHENDEKRHCPEGTIQKIRIQRSRTY